MEELNGMSWAKIDDRANEHKKQLKAGAEACWMWACGLMYANRQDARDGFIPEEALFMLYRFSNPEQLADKLVEVGLWDVVEGGWKVHNFHKWNLSKEQRDLELAAGRERAAKSYAKKKKSSTEDHSDSTGEEELKKNVSSGSGVVEDLSGSEKQKKRAPWKRFPKDFLVDESHKKLAAELGVNLEYQLELIRDHEFQVPKTDPSATLRRWIRTAAERTANRSGNTSYPRASPGKSDLIDTGNAYQIK